MPVLLLGAIFVAAGIVIMHAGRGATFSFDDWVFVKERLGWRPYIFLYPHNEHLSALPVFVYKVLLSTVGIDAYGVFRFVGLLFNLAIATLLFVYVRRRIGPWIALGLVTNLILTATSVWDIVWPFQIGFMGSLLTGVAALLLLDNNTRRSDIAACVMLVLSFSSSSQGIVVAGAVLLETLLRPDRFRRLWVPGIPILLYIAWRLKYGNGHLDWKYGITWIPNHIYHGLANAMAATTGFPAEYGAVFAAGVIAAVLYSLTRTDVRLPRLLAAVSLPVLFWVVMALARPGLQVEEQRYMYPTCVFVIVLIAEAFALLGPPRHPIPIVLGLMLALATLSNPQALNAFGDTLRIEAVKAKVNATAAEVLQGRLPLTYQVVPGLMSLQEYQRVADKYHSTIAWPIAEIPRRPADQRSAIDAEVIRASFPRATPTDMAPPPGCQSVPGTNKDTPVPAGLKQLYVSPGDQPAEVRLRRFGDSFDDKPIGIAPGKPVLITFTPDNSTRPWVAAVRSQAAVTACAA